MPSYLSSRAWPSPSVSSLGAISSPRSCSSTPGLGHLIYEAITYQDYFLLQGIFLFIILGVLIANFVIDIVYVIVDPRIRISMQGAA